MQHALAPPLLLEPPCHRPHRLGAEADPQAVLIGLDGFGRMVQPLRQLAQDLPLLRALAVERADDLGLAGRGLRMVWGGSGGGWGAWMVGGVGRVWVWGGGGRGRLGARHVGAPDGVDAQVLVQDHEEVVEPALAEAFVLEVGVVGVGWVRLRDGGYVNWWIEGEVLL